MRLDRPRLNFLLRVLSQHAFEYLTTRVPCNRTHKFHSTRQCFIPCETFQDIFHNGFFCDLRTTLGMSSHNIRAWELGVCTGNCYAYHRCIDYFRMRQQDCLELWWGYLKAAYFNQLLLPIDNIPLACVLVTVGNIPSLEPSLRIEALCIGFGILVVPGCYSWPSNAQLST